MSKKFDMKNPKLHDLRYCSDSVLASMNVAKDKLEGLVEMLHVSRKNSINFPFKSFHEVSRKIVEYVEDAETEFSIYHQMRDKFKEENDNGL